MQHFNCSFFLVVITNINYTANLASSTLLSYYVLSIKAQSFADVQQKTLSGCGLDPHEGGGGD